MRLLAGTGVLMRLVARRDRALLAVWVVLLGLFPLLMVIAQESLQGDLASRRAFVASIDSNSAFLMLYGSAYGASRGALGVWAAGAGFWFVAVASMLTVIRHTRTDEETGRRELLGATVVGRHAGLAAALIVTLAANLALALVAVLSLVVVGLPIGGSLAFGLSLAAVGWTFAALAAVAAQLTVSAQAARGLAFAGFGAAWLLRAVGDAAGPDGAASWLAWLSPLGWARMVRPFGGERWALLLLMLVVTITLTAGAVALAARRDVGAGVLRPRLGPAAAAPGLRTPLALAWRLHRGRMLAWTAGIALLSGVMSTSAKSAADLFESSPGMGRMFELVGSGSGPSEIFLSAIMGMLGLLAGAYGVAAMLRVRVEETAARAEPLLATSVSRLRWATSHLVFALLGPAVALGAAGLAGGLVYGSSSGELGRELPRVLAGALVQLPAVWILVGVTLALFGLRPRQAWGSWVPLGAFVLLWAVAMSLQLSQWLLNLSPFNQVPKLPGGAVATTPLLWLLGLAAALVVAGLAGFRGRDLES
ncbi:MAG: ABC transporter permease [Blastococcus sp.]|nr:ABC transporter permease [Blastococcus sp.]